MVNFRPKLWTNHRLTPLEKCFFFDFWNFLFLQPRKAFFFVLEYHKRHFPGLYCLKGKCGKMANFGRKPWTNPFGKLSILRLFELLFLYSLERRFFVVESHKAHCPGLYCLKRKGRKIANFGRKPWTNPFGKMLFFRLLELFVLLAQKGVFSFKNIIQYIFLGYIA